MAKLAIYMNDGGHSVIHHAGFSWLAALVVPVWALHHRLYKTAAVTLAINMLAERTVVRWIELIPGAGLRTGVQLGYLLAWWLAMGFGANVFHRKVLERGGYYMTSAEPGRLKATT